VSSCEQGFLTSQWQACVFQTKLLSATLLITTCKKQNLDVSLFGSKVSEQSSVDQTDVLSHSKNRDTENAAHVVPAAIPFPN